ncbi:MAG: ABC transporter ATP-binding protein [Vampirovibrionales bacterium]
MLISASQSVQSVLSADVASSAIVLEHVNKSYGKGTLTQQVLFDVSVTLPYGEMALIVGPSGCGKTTLISLIAGILNHDSGHLNVLGTTLDHLNDTQKTQLRKWDVGFIFQQYNLIPTLNVVENVAVPLLVQGKPRKEALQQAKEALAQVELEAYASGHPKDLSGGQQQRVAIARAIVHHPRLIICDEPTAALDGRTGKLVMDILKQVASHPERLVIVVTHDPRIYHYGDRIIEMEDGKIARVTQGPFAPMPHAIRPVPLNPVAT